MGESRHLNDRDKYKDNNRSTVVSRAIDGIRMSIDMTVLGKIAKLRTNAKNSNSLLPTLIQWCNTMLSSEGRVVDLFHQGGDVYNERTKMLLYRWSRVSSDIHRLRKPAFKLPRSKKGKLNFTYIPYVVYEGHHQHKTITRSYVLLYYQYQKLLYHVLHYEQARHRKN